MRAVPYLHSVRTRLTLWNVFVLALVLLVLGGILRLSIEHNTITSIDEDITSRARGSQWFWGQFFTRGPGARSGGPSRPGPDGIPGRGRRRGPRPMFAPPPSQPPSRWQARMEEKSLDLNGRRFFSPVKDGPLDEIGFIRAIHGEMVYSTVRIDDVPVRVVSAPIRGIGKITGVVQVGYALDGVGRALGNLDRTLLTLIPFALLAAGIGGQFLTWRMLRPVADITQTAGRIGAADLSQRLPVTGRDEFSKLAATINEMLVRLESSFEQQRRFTADASHELRTPLTVIKANTSLALARGDLSPAQQKSFESVDKAAAVMNSLVQDLLLLARSDAGQLELKVLPTRLSEVLDGAVMSVRPQDGPTIRNLAADVPIMVLGDPGHLSRLFVNLLDNAIRYTAADGCITLSAQLEGDGWAAVTVEDTGVGIAPEHLPHLCERFYRVDEARCRAHGGTGLGLAIGKSIVQAHGGSINIASTPGVGTTVRVTLRVLAPADAVTRN